MSEKTERAERRKRKEMAEKILAAQGFVYEDWLDKQHRAVIDEGAQTVDAALNLLIENQKKGRD
ncbi:MAG: hypothetical protein ABF683_01700 [Sporolactobacillus sp.]